MAKFKYKEIKRLDPRPGNQFATEYYKQTQAEYDRLKQHIFDTAQEITWIEQHYPDQYVWMTQPLRGFPKQNKREQYSPMEIITDALSQVMSGKDMPSGMLGRWNRLFAGWDIDIEMVDTLPPKNIYNTLFPNQATAPKPARKKKGSQS